MVLMEPGEDARGPVIGKEFFNRFSPAFDVEVHIVAAHVGVRSVTMTYMVPSNRPIAAQVEFASVCQALVVVLELFRIGNAIGIELVLVGIGNVYQGAVRR